MLYNSLKQLTTTKPKQKSITERNLVTILCGTVLVCC